MYAKLHFEQQPFITKITDWTTHFAELPKTFLNIHCLYNKIILTYIKNLNIMKKFFIATILAVAAVLPASAQVRSLDMKANLRSDFGLGIGVTFQLPRNFEFAPSLNYYFNDSNTLNIDGDFVSSCHATSRSTQSSVQCSSTPTTTTSLVSTSVLDSHTTSIHTGLSELKANTNMSTIGTMRICRSALLTNSKT